MTRDEVEKNLSEYGPALRFVERRIRDDLHAFCDDRGLPFIGRIKSADSIAEKIEGGRLSKWSEIDDIIAFSIVIPSMQQEKLVLDFLSEKFNVAYIKLRGSSNKSPDSFRFDSTRFIGTLRVIGEADSKDPSYKVLFEIQIRTAFEHAWSVTTHQATYKPEVVDWRRLRLAAQLKAAVEQLDALVVGFDKVSEQFSTSAWPEVDAQAAVVDFTAGLHAAGKIGQTSMPASLGRFAENFVKLVKTAKKSRFDDVVGDVSAGLDIIAKCIKRGEDCPKSLSVYQWFISQLIANDFLSGLTSNYPLPIDQSVVSEVGTQKTNRFKAFDWAS